jgi:RNA recognition motif-containing protein
LLKSTLFVTGLPKNYTNKEFTQIFKEFGEVFSAKVSLTPEGLSKGLGHVTFKDEQSAKMAVDHVNFYRLSL